MWQAVEFDEAAKLRIEQAGRAEKQLRLSAYLNATTDLGVCHIAQLTAANVIELEFAENGVVTGDGVDHTDIAHYCWLLRSPQERRKQAKFVRDVVKWYAQHPDLAKQVVRHFRQSFIDLPTASKADGRVYNSQVWLSPMVDCIASEYGWTLPDIMQTPIALCMQLLQQIYKRRFGKKYCINNPMTQKAIAQEMRRAQHG